VPPALPGRRLRSCRRSRPSACSATA
jgi:hypothetical protein